MNSGRSSVGVAVGFVLGVLFCIIFAYIAYPWFRDPFHSPELAGMNRDIGSGEVKPTIEWLGIIVRSIEIRDTLAQWTMAVFAIVATGISIWAVNLLRKTLVATEKTLAEAQKTSRYASKQISIAANETRPFAKLDVVIRSTGFSGERKLGIQLQINVENLGKQPIGEFEIYYKAFTGQAVGNPIKLAKRFYLLCLQRFQRHDTRRTQAIFVDQTFTIYPACYLRRTAMQRGYLGCCVVYRGVFGNEIYHTGVTIDLHYNDEGSKIHPHLMVDRPIPLMGSIG